jgi:hypothetical protein
VVEIKRILLRNYLQHDAACIENQTTSYSLESKGCVSLESPCQVFVDRPASLGTPIHCCFNHDIHIDLIYTVRDTSLSPHMSISFHIIIIHLDSSRKVANGFESEEFGTVNQHLVMREASEEIE